MEIASDSGSEEMGGAVSWEVVIVEVRVEGGTVRVAP
jgi:hypothetical protein